MLGEVVPASWGLQPLGLGLGLIWAPRGQSHPVGGGPIAQPRLGEERHQLILGGPPSSKICFI
jgi:hypothetical protein